MINVFSIYDICFESQKNLRDIKITFLIALYVCVISDFFFKF